MGRLSREDYEFGGPLKEYWRAINRAEKAAKSAKSAKRKEYDKRRPRCRCDAYKFPHRPGGGLCRFPDSPAVRWQDAQAAEIAGRVAKFKARHDEPLPEQMGDLIALTKRPTRPYRNRYSGLRREIARNNGWHSIRDRALIQKRLDVVLMWAKQLKARDPKMRYRSIEIAETGVIGYAQRIGPMMYGHCSSIRTASAPPSSSKRPRTRINYGPC